MIAGIGDTLYWTMTFSVLLDTIVVDPIETLVLASKYVRQITASVLVDQRLCVTDRVLVSEVRIMRTISPIDSLAFSIQANPGVYALLLGSGASRSAGVPTGWEIVLDLIGKLAAARGQSAVPDLEQWYCEEYGEAADYSNLLSQLAISPSERQQLLRPYIEPTDQDREEGLKQPTATHRSIALLVAQGFIKVIVTTNFDRLLEKALEDVGVIPTVLSSSEQVEGALPLIHTKCCVFKVHGDYMDTRIRNSSEELDNYPNEFVQLLDQIFDEFGFIVCGWSAEWDSGLRNAISRAKSRRFTTYWALCGELGDEARQIIDLRGAEIIPINDADSFFQQVQETVESIEEFSRPHPLSAGAAVGSLKRYLSSPEHRIRLVDLIHTSIEEVANATSGEEFKVQRAPSPTRESITARARVYESACSTILSMAPIAGFWATGSHFNIWERAIQRLTNRLSGSGYTIWLEMSAYPGRLLLYALGLGAVEAGNLRFLSHIFKTRVGLRATDGQPEYALTALFDQSDVHLLTEGENSTTPFSDRVHHVLRQPLQQLTPDDESYDFIFDKLEILMALGFHHLQTQRGLSGWYPYGAFIRRMPNWRSVLAEVTDSISESRSISQFVQCGIIGKTPEDCIQSLESFESFLSSVSQQHRIYR